MQAEPIIGTEVTMSAPEQELLLAALHTDPGDWSFQVRNTADSYTDAVRGAQELAGQAITELRRQREQSVKDAYTQAGSQPADGPDMRGRRTPSRKLG